MAISKKSMLIVTHSLVIDALVNATKRLTDAKDQEARELAQADIETYHEVSKMLNFELDQETAVW